MSSRDLVPLVAVGILLTAADLEADTVTIVSNRDNTLYENALGLTSNGAGKHFFAGRNAVGENRRGVIRFPVEDSLPLGAPVTSVTLTLHMSKTIAPPVPVNLHRLVKDWGEGASDADFEEGGGAASEPGDATWLHTFYDTIPSQAMFWTTPGGDFYPTFSASRMVDSLVGFYTWS